MNKFFYKIYFSLKKFLYSFFSNNRRVEGTYVSFQPVVLRGKGSMFFGNDVSFGVINSPRFHDSYAYLEARFEDSIIEIGNNVHINNGFSMTAEKGIVIGDNTIIGLNCMIMDSNFHDLDPVKRELNDESPEKVIVGKNTFIGHNVTILKGVEIGKNSIIGANSVVTRSFPENSIIAGNPAKLLRRLD